MDQELEKRLKEIERRQQVLQQAIYDIGSNMAANFTILDKGLQEKLRELKELLGNERENE